jgi:hypothetical protein
MEGNPELKVGIWHIDKVKELREALGKHADER